MKFKIRALAGNPVELRTQLDNRFQALRGQNETIKSNDLIRVAAWYTFVVYSLEDWPSIKAEMPFIQELQALAKDRHLYTDATLLTIALSYDAIENNQLVFGEKLATRGAFHPSTPDQPRDWRRFI